MALVASDRVMTCTYSFIDRDDNVRTTEVNLPGDTDIDVAQSFYISTGTLIEAMSDAVLVGALLTIPFDVDPAPGVAAETSDVERKGVVTFQTSARTPAKYEIPSIRNTLVVDGTNILDANAAAVIAYIGLMVNGASGVNPVSGAGLDLIRLHSARKIHRGSRRG